MSAIVTLKRKTPYCTEGSRSHVAEALLRCEPSVSVAIGVLGEKLCINIEKLTSEGQHQITLTHSTSGPAFIETDLVALVMSDGELWAAYNDGELVNKLETAPVLYPDEITAELCGRFRQYVAPLVAALTEVVHRLAGEDANH